MIIMPPTSMLMMEFELINHLSRHHHHHHTLHYYHHTLHITITPSTSPSHPALLLMRAQDAQRALKLFFTPTRQAGSGALAVPPNMVQQSHVTRHTSHVTRHTSHVTRHRCATRSSSSLLLALAAALATTPGSTGFISLLSTPNPDFNHYTSAVQYAAHDAAAKVTCDL